MKKSIIITAILLFFILFICSCSSVPKFENDELGNLTDKANGRLYLYCGSYLRAAEIIENAYARYDNYDGKYKATLHEIPGADPAEWLSENINNLGLPLLFREASIDEPTLENFGAERIHITQTGEINVRIGLIDEERQVQSIVRDYVHGENINPPENIETNLLLYFESPKYTGIYYVLNYFTDVRGEEYLFDRWTRRCVLLTEFGGNKK